MRKIPLDQSADILGKRNAKIAGAPACTPLKLIFKGDLGTSHHDGYIIAQIWVTRTLAGASSPE
jgi:hypothetical protein